ncbi:hypothetical protein DFQ29_001492 [Apophysomyces sp. BC1021]|nr:hypothetical protein DFQ29_001492 [Apophysomyces sp. BC1021]
MLLHRTHLFCLIAGAFFTTYFLYQFLPSSNKPIVEEIVEYEDTTQMTDYALLDKLFRSDQAYNQHEVQTQFNRYERTPLWVANSKDPLPFSKQLALHHPEMKGHTSIELEKLANSAMLPSTVSVTAIVHVQPLSQLHTQVTALLEQTTVPTTVWIACKVDEKEQVERVVAAFNDKHVKVIVRDEAWLQLSLHTTTDYVWILDQGVVPGRQYLQRLLKLSHTKEYRHALLGTEASVLVQDGTLCIQSDTSQPADMIDNMWILRRSWLSGVLSDVGSSHFSISRALREHVGIPSIFLPTDDADALGETRPDHSRSCKVMQENKTIDKGAVAFVVNGVEEMETLAPLFCRFSQNTPVHVITTTGSIQDTSELLQQNYSSCGPVHIHSLDIDHHTNTNYDGASWRLPNEIIRGLTSAMSMIRPRLMIHVRQRVNTIGYSIDMVGKLADTVTIGLPARDIPHALWMADLPLEALEQWHHISIKLMIQTDSKPHSLARLIRSAARAHYMGDTVDMTLMMDQTSDKVTQAFVNSLPWPHGRKLCRHRIVKVNRMPLFVESWYPTGNHEYAILLDSSLEVSELFYTWAKYAVLRYRYADRDSSMFGVSLYSPRLIETDPNGRYLFDPAATLDNSGYQKRSPYLMQSPTPFGALYFPEHWREFHDYITARLADQAKKQLQNVTVPNSRSSQWTNAWRRYLDELIYMRAYVMLYPNYENHLSLSTHYLELSSESYAGAAMLYNVPLLSENADLPELPAYKELPILDLWGNLQSMDVLTERGLTLQREVSACTPIRDHQHDPSDLLCPFAQIVTVPVTSEDEEVPDLPTRVVTIYVTPTPEPTHGSNNELLSEEEEGVAEEEEDQLLEVDV